MWAEATWRTSNGEGVMERAGRENLLSNLRATGQKHPVFSLEVWSWALLLWIIIALLWAAI
jgi:hypothetical protein